MVKLIFSAFLTIFLTSNVVLAQHKNFEPHALNWADSILNTLRIDEKIGQLFMVAAYSEGNEQHHHALEQLIKSHHIGGLIFMQGGPLRQANLTNRFQSESKIPLFIGMDMEWGLGMRLDSTVTFPKQMTLGAIQDVQLVYAMGNEIGKQMTRLGVNVAFAPVADINSNPQNSVLGSRSFGQNTDRVIERSKAYMDGLQDAGILSVAKHFPGHGDTNVDSHESLPTILAPNEVLSQRELKPFESLIDSGLDGVMTGHLLVPALTDKEDSPATLSRTIITETLKEKLDFRGLAFTDALNMKPIRTKYENGEAELLAFKAGNDILLFSTQVPLAIKKIKKAIKRNSQLKQQLNNTVRKILAYKYEKGLVRSSAINTDNLVKNLNNNHAKALKHELYKRAVTLVKNDQQILPIKKLDQKYIATLLFSESKEFTDGVSYYTNTAQYHFKTDSIGLLDRLKNYDHVIVGVFEPTNNNQRTFLKQLSSDTHIILCHAGSGNELKDLSPFNTIVHIEESNIITHRLLAEAIFGAIAVNGRLPVRIVSIENDDLVIEPIHRLATDVPENVGMSSNFLGRINSIVDEALTDQATPGGQIIIARKGRVIYENNFGYYTYDSIKPVTSETIYDIASITKVAATLQAFMFLHERGEIDLEKKLSYYLPELKGTNKEHMLLIDILTHQSGLWPYLPFWKQTMEDSTFIEGFYNEDLDSEFQHHVAPGLFATKSIKDSVWNWVKDSKVIKKKGREPYEYRYSDMGYYLLQRLIEKQLNQGMEQFLQHNIYNPMGLSSTGYLPLCSFPVSRIAPTEEDNYFRNTLVYGMVHDQGAALIGGVAGHAGLFSNARDLAKLMQMHLQGGLYGGQRFLQPGTIGTFTKQQYASNRRGIGWDKPAQAQWYGPSSRFASGKTFGHTGFTGTAAWVDPEFDLVYIFISNRIHPDATNRKLIQNNIRTRIQEVIYESIWEFKQYSSDE